MPTARLDEAAAQKATNGTKGSPRKRKQEPEGDFTAQSTPSKVTKRVKHEALTPIKGSRKAQTQPQYTGKNDIINDLTSKAESGREEEEVLITIRDKSKAKPKVKTNAHSESDQVKTPVSAKKARQVKAEAQLAESTPTKEKNQSTTPSERKTKSNKKAAVAVGLKKAEQFEGDASNKTPRKPKATQEKNTETISTELKEEADTPLKKKPTPKSKVTEAADLKGDGQVVNETPKKARRKRKTQEEKEAEAMPLAARTRGLRMFIGAHVSIATGVEKAVTNCLHIGGNAFALFLQSQRKWDNKPLLDENRLAFISMCEEHKYNASDHVLPHGSYLVNLAQEEKDRAKQAYDHFLDDLKRCEALGIKMYNFHPGAAGKAPLPEAINRISTQLNRALAETQTAIPVLENMCGSGSVIGSRFSDLRDIIAGIKPEYKARIGVCIDTCHAFAAGYDLRTPEAFQKTIQEFDDVVGLRYLKGLHLNDSKGPFGSHRDLHQNIGLGFLGLRAFHNVMNEPRFHNMPLILETPCDRIDPSDPTGKKTIEDKGTWAREIKLLESLIGMDPESDEFKNLEQELSEKGRASREKMQYAIDQKNEKAKKMPEKGQRSLVDMIGKKNKNKNKNKNKMEMEMESTENSSLSDEEEVNE